MLCVPLSAMADGLGNSIIIYFDYSENIVTDGLDVDAVSSASRLPRARACGTSAICW